MAAPVSAEVNKTAHTFERSALEGLLIKRFFFCPAFEIYGGELQLYSARRERRC
jgi:glycyl-tRNA synthetase